MTTPQEMTATIAEALALLTTEEADAIIGVTSVEYGKLIQAMQAESGLLYAVLSQGHGLRRNKGTEKTIAKAMIVFYQLLHFAYALGIRRGRNAQA